MHVQIRLVEIKDEIKKEKHKDFGDENFNEVKNKKAIREKQNPIQITTEKQAKKEENREAARVRRGVERAVEHSRKIGEATRRHHLTTRKITDQQIDEIRAARNQRHEKLEDIATSFGFSRQYVANVAKGLVLKSTEQDDEEKIKAIADKHKEKRESNVEKGVEKLAISRRKVAPSVVIEIIAYKKAHPWALTVT